jgi:hypothetical protein
VATLSNTFAGWTSPYQGGTDPTTIKIFQSLSSFLYKPNFPGGITVGGPAALTDGLTVSGAGTTLAGLVATGTVTLAAGTTVNGQVVSTPQAHPMLLQAFAVTPTLSSGGANVAYPSSFPTAVLAVMAQNAAGSNLLVNVITTGTAIFAVRVYVPNTGALTTATSLAMNVIAVGY